MWGSDYPHDEGTPPYTRETLRAVFNNVPEVELRDVLAGNAASSSTSISTRSRRSRRSTAPRSRRLAQPLTDLPEKPNAALLKAVKRPAA